MCRLQAFAISAPEMLIQLTWGIIQNFKINFKRESKRDWSNVNVLCKRANCDKTTNTTNTSVSAIAQAHFMYTVTVSASLMASYK